MSKCENGVLPWSIILNSYSLSRKHKDHIKKEIK